MSGVDIPPDLIGQSSLYASSDPLLRRLRLEDSTGASIQDVAAYFQGKEVLVLYAGSEEGSVNLKEFHRNLTTLVMRYLKTLGVIYISTDTDPSSPQRVLSTQPWLRMTFCDNSDFAPMIRTGEKGGKGMEVEMEEVSRGEEFVQAGEIEIGVEKVEFGVEEDPQDYVRPLSRAAVTSLMSAYSTPSVAIYYLATHRIILKNVKLSAFEPNKVDEFYALCRKAGAPKVGLYDLFQRMKWSLLLLLLGAVYHLAIQYGGDQYNFLPRIMDKLAGR